MSSSPVSIRCLMTQRLSPTIDLSQIAGDAEAVSSTHLCPTLRLRKKTHLPLPLPSDQVSSSILGCFKRASTGTRAVWTCVISTQAPANRKFLYSGLTRYAKTQRWSPNEFRIGFPPRLTSIWQKWGKPKNSAMIQHGARSNKFLMNFNLSKGMRTLAFSSKFKRILELLVWSWLTIWWRIPNYQKNWCSKDRRSSCA